MQFANPFPALSVVLRFWPVALTGGLIWAGMAVLRTSGRLRAVMAAVGAFFAAALVLRAVEAPHVVKALWLYGGTGVVSLTVAWAVHPFVRWYWRQMVSPAETVSRGTPGNAERRRRRNRRVASRAASRAARGRR